jgi:excisionase family DNA binding protein
VSINNQHGVFISDDDARLLADVLDIACTRMRPSARVADLARRLRLIVDSSAATANGSANGRAGQPDPGEIRAHDLLAAGEAAAILCCTTSNIRYLRRKGHLPAHRAGSRWLFPAAAVVERAEKRAAKRGRSCPLTSAPSPPSN